MRWSGVRRKSSEVAPIPGAAHTQINLVMRHREGEISRRSGFARSSLASLGVPILGIAPANPSSGPYIIVQPTGGTLEGSRAFDPQWGAAQLKTPTGTAAQAGAGDAIASTVHNINETDSPELNFFDGPFDINTGGANGNDYDVTFIFDLVASTSDPLVGVSDDWSATMTVEHSLISSVVSEGTGDIQTPTGDSPLVAFISSGESDDPSFPITGEVTFRVAGGWQYEWNPLQVSAIAPFATVGLAGTITVEVTQVTGLSAGTYTITIDRVDDFVTAFDVYAKDGTYPLEPGDGVFVETVEIAPGATSVTTAAWTPPSAGTWKFIAVPRRGDQIGPVGRMA